MKDKRTKKYIVRELLNGYGIFENKRKSTCIRVFYKHIDAINYSFRLNTDYNELVK